MHGALSPPRDRVVDVVVDEIAAPVQLLLRQALDAGHQLPIEARVVEDIVDGPRRDGQAQLVANVMASAELLRPPLLHKGHDFARLRVGQRLLAATIAVLRLRNKLPGRHCLNSPDCRIQSLPAGDVP